MRVFVLGTGRCGTVTFAKACSHITNFSSAHESKAGVYTLDRFHYPNNHIEVDPHLAYMLGHLGKIHRSDDFYVHLYRPPTEVVGSWQRRGRKEIRGAAPLIGVLMQVNPATMTTGEYRTALRTLHDIVITNIKQFLKDRPHMSIGLYALQDSWPEFWNRIKASGNYRAAHNELAIRHNAS